MSWEQITRWKVVRNAEEQYSIWPADRDIPAGWFEEGKAGSREECLHHIDEVWTDLRPRSLREAVTPPPVEEVYPEAPSPRSLVEFLSHGEHPLEVPHDVCETIRGGYLVVCFADTVGGTRLGFSIDQQSSRLDEDAPAIHVEGRLRLDGRAVRCVVDVDLRSRAGTGRLVED